ncbi:inosine monophosphate dehydrogenase [Microthyrium microscopicum]|uniref:Inosine monophosphate dehydrogenase n=1 Tax=Microthyrium microscopicum TaxID=703497 RepID=A0A6A6U5M0_9PEZI|nr:inosine monophosphate dehydrogenase [Microthyrium microscopicum]
MTSWRHDVSLYISTVSRLTLYSPLYSEKTLQSPTMTRTILNEWFPNTTYPFISNAPMQGTATSKLGSAVSKAGRSGFIGGAYNFLPESPEIPAFDAELTAVRNLLQLREDDVLPLGVGFLTLHPSVSGFLDVVGPVVKRQKPAAVWLFAPDGPLAHERIIPGLKELGSAWKLRVFVQVGNVAAAREAASQGADAIVAQGADAGGHAWAHGAGIVTLVPEIRQMVQTEFSDREIAVVAAGGIVDGRGIAAALALGADGVTMGTRFIVADEAMTPDDMKDTVIKTKDGASSTIKHTIHDDIQGTGFWPKAYDGRAIMGKAYEEYVAGTPLDELKARHQTLLSAKDNSRRIVWAGSAVGLVNSRKPAGEIIVSAGNEARQIIEGLSKGLKL